MMNARIAPFVSVLTGAGCLAFAPAASAHPSYLTAWTTKYPASTLPARMLAATGSSCNVCHHPTSTSNPGNCYKDALSGAIGGGLTITAALTAVENQDSDIDGVSNKDEILAPRVGEPGQVGYSPGLKGPTGTDPCGSNPTAAVTNQLETPPATCYANCDASTNAPILNVNDFICFNNLFAAGNSLANCDASTIAPTLNVNDFTCFLNKYASGCA